MERVQRGAIVRDNQSPVSDYTVMADRCVLHLIMVFNKVKFWNEIQGGKTLISKILKQLQFNQSFFISIRLRGVHSGE